MDEQERDELLADALEEIRGISKDCRAKGAENRHLLDAEQFEKRLNARIIALRHR